MPLQDLVTIFAHAAADSNPLDRTADALRARAIGHAFALLKMSHTKISQAWCAIFGDKNIRRFNIAMDNAQSVGTR